VPRDNDHFPPSILVHGPSSKTLTRLESKADLPSPHHLPDDRKQVMRFIVRLGLAIAAGLVTIVVNTLPPTERIDLNATDHIRRLVGRSTPSKNVVVIAIDEASYTELGVGFDKPWPRALHAKLLRRLKELGARSVAFDILFTGPGADPAVDQELIEAFRGTNSIIGVEAIRKTVAKQGGGIVIEEIDQPYDEFRKVTTQALVNLNMNTKDGFIRTFPFPTSDQTKRFPFLAFAAAGAPSVPEMRKPAPRDMIKYYGSARENSRIVSYWEMFERMAPAEEASFKDAVVFVGLLLRADTGVAQKDSYLSPFGGEMIFGVEVHATIAGNLLEQSWIRRPSRALELMAVGIVGGVVTFIGLSYSPIILASAVGTLVTGWVIASLVSVGSNFFMAGAATVLILLPLGVLVSAMVSYVGARRSEEALRSAFSLYVSPDMVPKLEGGESALKLGGEKLWLTAVFTDIADFTTITEEMPAEKTSDMLNAYFTEVMDVVFANQGTLLKFIGDAVFAIWGAPVKIANHAEMGIKTAMAIQKGVEKFNSSQRYPPLITRVGVHTGPMLVGNLGSKKRFDYTAIGDAVNLASRIEGLNKYFGTTILLSEATRKDAGGFAGAVLVATVRVKGRREPVSLYSIFDPPLAPEVVSDWKLALELFAKVRPDEAIAVFERVSVTEPRLAASSALYIERSRTHREITPHQGWDGELDFDVK
jgi:adenylate cyclase